ncbi:MAG: 2-hydroxychromene-2-carboxylate isomerase [Polyangiaceae bacterium]|nr:2-hydroxychromene-2-carboxylate isomerase [Polyangiaceae bacterium]
MSTAQSKTIEFYFDFSSPYSYLAATQLPEIAARTGAKIAYRPFVLAAVFKASSNDMPAKVPAKGAYMLKDLERWAEFYGVRFKFSSHFPANTIKAMRLVLVADEQGKAESVALGAFRAMWAEDRDLNDPVVLGDIAEKAGLDPQAALSAIESQPIKDRLRANGDAAIARGAFGAPAMFVGDELFWGNDRLNFVERALQG